MRKKKKFPALPLGLKSEVLETRMTISPNLKRRGRIFRGTLRFEILEYYFSSSVLLLRPEFGTQGDFFTLFSVV